MPWTFDDDTASRLLGSSATVELVVGDADTAAHLGSGDLDVLATPRVVALVEEAACVALAGSLPADVTSVGTRIDLRHRAPTAVGSRVRATATVVGVDGMRVQFDVTAAEDPDGAGLLIADGTHARVVVERDAFVSSLAERSTTR